MVAEQMLTWFPLPGEEMFAVFKNTESAIEP